MIIINSNFLIKLGGDITIFEDIVLSKVSVCLILIALIPNSK